MPPRFARPAFLGNVPPITLRLLIATGLTTLLCVLAAHAGYPQLAEAFVLRPIEVVPGLRVWKLLSYLFFLGSDPISFLLDLLVLYFFCAWLERAWGSRRFLTFYALAGAGAAAFVTIIGLFSPTVAEQPYFGIWAVMEALTVAMGLLQPNMEIYFYMLFPVKARNLMFLSWGLIALFMVFGGSVVPFLPAVGGALMGILMSTGVNGPRRLWLNFRAAQIERQLRRKASHLKVVPPPDKDRDGGPKTYLH